MVPGSHSTLRRSPRALLADTRGLSSVGYVLLACLVAVVSYSSWEHLGALVADRVEGVRAVIAEEDHAGMTGVRRSPHAPAPHSGGGDRAGDDRDPTRGGAGDAHASHASHASHETHEHEHAPAIIPRARGSSSSSGASHGRPPPEIASRPPLAAGAPDGRNERTRLVEAITERRGRADELDAQFVRQQLARIPIEDLRRLEAGGARVLVGRGNVADAMASLRGQRPRGWPPGSTFEDVEGVRTGTGRRVIIGVSRDPVGHPTTRSPTVVLHEVGHALDELATDGGSRSREFADARARDLATLPAYERQPGAAGLEETYAQSYARYIDDPEGMRRTQPSLYAYWSSRRPRLGSERPRLRP
jgi:hypothetical protein